MTRKDLYERKKAARLERKATEEPNPPSHKTPPARQRLPEKDLTHRQKRKARLRLTKKEEQEKKEDQEEHSAALSSYHTIRLSLRDHSKFHILPKLRAKLLAEGATDDVVQTACKNIREEDRSHLRYLYESIVEQRHDHGWERRRDFILRQRRTNGLLDGSDDGALGMHVRERIQEMFPLRSASDNKENETPGQEDEISDQEDETQDSIDTLYADDAEDAEDGSPTHPMTICSAPIPSSPLSMVLSGPSRVSALERSIIPRQSPNIVSLMRGPTPALKRANPVASRVQTKRTEVQDSQDTSDDDIEEVMDNVRERRNIEEGVIGDGTAEVIEHARLDHMGNGEYNARLAVRGRAEAPAAHPATSPPLDPPHTTVVHRAGLRRSTRQRQPVERAEGFVNTLEAVEVD
ncbi:hypothetical protein N0V83_006447 [Neocucurbitaria cava]|uniref:Uncharacterized protein n=1 Tax=Neocucurbitaria cava TaxID=798079 RepID=A0A9W8Y6W5_9PLEO|nr:hypothetical protein N0V83_006447 [Neocucurbitaria cava]